MNPRLLKLRAKLQSRLSKLPLSFITRYQTAWTAVGLAFMAVIFAYLCHRIGHHGLGPEALDQAQLARNVAEGRGFTTYFIRPVNFLATGTAGAMPELTNAPLLAFVLALAFSVLGAGDKIVMLVSLLIYAAAVAVVYLLANRLSRGNRWTAVLTVIIFVFSQSVILMAPSGTPLVLSTFLVTLLLFILTPRNFAEIETAPAASSQAATKGRAASSAVIGVGWRRWVNLYSIAGLIAGLCYLTDYLSVVYVLILAFFWGHALNSWNRRTVTLFAGGFILICLPWWIRNIRLTGNPFYTLQWLELASRTSGFPGSSLFRTMSGEAPDVVFLAPGFFEFLKKMGRGVTSYFFQAPMVPHLYLSPFVLLALWQRSTIRLLEMCKWGILTALVVYVVALSAFGRVSLLFLIPLAPVLAFVGVSALSLLFQQWMRRWIDSKSERGSALRMNTIFRVRVLFGVAFAAVLLFPLSPLMSEVWRSHQKPPPGLAYSVTGIKTNFPLKRPIASDVPWAVAWYADRPSIWLPNKIEKINDIEKKERLGGIYLTPSLLTYSVEEGLGDWQRIYKAAQDLNGYRKTVRVETNDIIHTRYASLEEAEKLAREKPNDASAWADLGRARLEANKLQPALVAFIKAQKLAPKAAGPVRGAGVVHAKLNHYSTARDYFERAIKLAPRDLPSSMGLAQMYLSLSLRKKAIEVYENVLSDYPNYPEAVNNLAYLYAEDDRELRRALEMARRAVGNFPRNEMMWDTLGWVSFRMGRAQEAVQYLETAASLAPKQPLIYYHLGRAYAAVGNRAGAAAALQTALVGKLTPADRRAAEEAYTNLR